MRGKEEKRVGETKSSLIKNPLLELQNDSPLPKEAKSLLALGPKFAVTPMEIPKMKIMSEIEKCCLTLERKGKKKEAQEVRHNAANVLKKAGKPKFNLTSEQKKGLAYLKKQDKIAAPLMIEAKAL